MGSPAHKYLFFAYSTHKKKLYICIHCMTIIYVTYCAVCVCVCVRFSSKFEQTLLTHINRREYTNMRNILKNTWPIQFFRPIKKRDYFPIYMRWCSSYASTILSLPSQPSDIRSPSLYCARCLSFCIMNFVQCTFST